MSAIRWLHGIECHVEGSRKFDEIQAVGLVLCRRYVDSRERGVQVVGYWKAGPRIELVGTDTDGERFTCHIFVGNPSGDPGVHGIAGTTGAFRKAAGLLNACRHLPVIGQRIKRISVLRTAIGYVEVPQEERDSVKKTVGGRVGVLPERVSYIVG